MNSPQKECNRDYRITSTADQTTPIWSVSEKIAPSSHLLCTSRENGKMERRPPPPSVTWQWRKCTQFCPIFCPSQTTPMTMTTNTATCPCPSSILPHFRWMFLAFWGFLIPNWLFNPLLLGLFWLLEALKNMPNLRTNSAQKQTYFVT